MHNRRHLTPLHVGHEQIQHLLLNVDGVDFPFFPNLPRHSPRKISAAGAHIGDGVARL